MSRIFIAVKLNFSVSVNKQIWGFYLYIQINCQGNSGLKSFSAEKIGRGIGGILTVQGISDCCYLFYMKTY